LRRVANVDGGIGWPLIRERITQFDARTGKFHFLAGVPKEANAWVKFTLLTNQAEGEVLAFELPDRDDGKGVIFIDTGAVGREGGIDLSPRRWKEWKAANPQTWVGFRWRSWPSGLNVSEAAWASKISIGNLELSDIVVGQTDQAENWFSPKELVAVLGYQALKHLDLIVEGKGLVAYLRPVKASVQPPLFLRGSGGVVFASGNSQATDLIAHVTDGSPAFESGIRNGNVLSEVDNHSITQWLTNPGRSWTVDQVAGSVVASGNVQAGAKVELTLRRGDQTFKTDVLQKDIVILAPLGKK
jgi:hypothetical protein